MANVFFPSCKAKAFGVFGSYIFCRERIENTYKNLLIIPVGRIQFAVAKMLVMLVSIITRKGFLLSICISIVYSLASFLTSWVAPLAAILPIDVAWRIIDIILIKLFYVRGSKTRVYL